MPIVLSYNDVEALGTLAYQTGREQGTAQRQQFDHQLLQQYDAQRNQTAARLQQVDARQQQATQQDAFRRDQLATQTALQREGWERDAQQFEQQQAMRLHQTQTRAQQDEADRQTRLQQELLRQGGRQDLAQYRHALDMQKLEREAELGKYSRSGSADESYLGPGGMPTSDYVERELTQHGHLIPFDVSAGTTRGVQREQDSQTEIAESIASLPTGTIYQRMRTDPEDPWIPFMRSIVESREGVAPGGDLGGAGQPGRSVVPQGYSNPEAGGRKAPHTPPRQNLGGRGAGQQTGMEELSDAELQQMADQYNREQRDPSRIDITGM